MIRSRTGLESCVDRLRRRPLARASDCWALIQYSDSVQRLLIRCPNTRLKLAGFPSIR
jgi:hypothetical protein